MTTDSLVKGHELDRRSEFRPNPALDQLIGTLRPLLAPAQENVNRQFQRPRFPVVVVIGNPRSGETLLTQVLARSGAFSYPTNLLARFAYSPYVGALIQQMLFNPDYDFRGELADMQPRLSYTSTLGKTAGALEVNEFFHFWRRFFPTHEPGYLSATQLAQVQSSRLRCELGSLESAFGKPFMSKGKMLQYNVAHFAKEIPELFFVHVRRDPRYVMQSVLLARRQYYQRDDIWWSVKPREFDWLSRLSPAAQIAGQIYFTDHAIQQELRALPDARSTTVEYEALCADPGRVLEDLSDRLGRLGYTWPTWRTEDSFTCRNSMKLETSELEPMERYYEQFASGIVDPGNLT